MSCWPPKDWREAEHGHDLVRHCLCQRAGSEPSVQFDPHVAFSVPHLRSHRFVSLVGLRIPRLCVQGFESWFDSPWESGAERTRTEKTERTRIAFSARTHRCKSIRSSMRDRTESWLLTSRSRQRKRPGLKLRLVPARGSPAGLGGLNQTTEEGPAIRR